jgi:hypothetical protein
MSNFRRGSDIYIFPMDTCILSRTNCGSIRATGGRCGTSHGKQLRSEKGFSKTVSTSIPHKVIYDRQR